MKAIILLLVLVAYVVNSFADAVDHGRGAKPLKTLWHLSKALSYGILITIIMFLLHVQWQVWVLLWAALWVWWETAYNLFRWMNVAKWDDAFDWQWLKKLWRY